MSDPIDGHLMQAVFYYCRYCPKCKEHVEADKKFDIWNLPKYLVIHLKRFQYSRYLREKIDTFVDYPVQ